MERSLRVLAVAAHPDDIEFGMAGTFILLGRAGCRLHYMNIADGSCGSMEMTGEEIARVRLEESRKAASGIGAVFHPPLAQDLEIFYGKELLSRLASVVREADPDVLLVPSPQDYMEDHMNACRLAVTAAFCRGIPNFPVEPPRPAVGTDVTVYHAQPYGNRDGMNRVVVPDFFVDITSVMDAKAAMLARHDSQKSWLDASQGIDSYIDTMWSHAAEMGEMSGRFEYAEGWRRHNPIGFCPPDADPLADLLSEHIIRRHAPH